MDAGIRPRLHLEDATRAPMEFMQEFIAAVQEMCAPSGLRPKFRVCDTMGLGLPYEDVALPRSMPRIFATLRAMGLAAEELEFHPLEQGRQTSMEWEEWQPHVHDVHAPV